MKTAGRRRSSQAVRSRAITELRARLSEAEETLHAIRTGGVDALVVAGKGGPRIYTLEGAEHAYRVLIESMNEGALILSPSAVILYANQRFARMVKRPLARVIGQSFQAFLSVADQAALKPILKRSARPGSTIQVLLHATDTVQTPAHISIRRLARNGSDSAAFGMVVADMTEARLSERRLRSLSHSLLQTQEVDRRRLAIELHDRASQSLGAVLIRLRLLAGSLPARAGKMRREVGEIGELVCRTAEVVEAISKNLRPSVLEILGLASALSASIADFRKRTLLPVEVAMAPVPAQLSAEGELVLYRTLEEALKNVEKHAGARNVTVRLRRRGAVVELAIGDDGVGFHTAGHAASRRKNEGTGLIGLRERVTHLGGALRIRSTRGTGTRIVAHVPVTPMASRPSHDR